MPLNDSQRLCAEGFGASLAVIAGAGSGKTFTLKERIANAFDPDIVAGRMDPLTSIDEVMAITFTERAALELKGRVRSTLKSRGLTDQALLVDTAWISTIHGMCARILRENALELGIDPAFEVVADDRRMDLLNQAIEDAFQGMPKLAKHVNALFEEYSLTTLKDMVVKLVDLAGVSPEGLLALQDPHAGRRADLRTEMALYDAVGSYLAHQSGSDKVKVTAAEVVDFIDMYGPSGEKVLDDGTTITWDAPWGEDEGLTKVGRINRIALELRLLAASKLWWSLEAVAEATVKRFGELKREQGALDNNDLLVLTAQAFWRKDIRERYADRFRLVMVDEFQDTDQTQLDIIRVLAGPNCERLCVVGDPQQSIYRFRGADLSVCEGHLATIPDAPDRQIRLDTNYRSHPDILDFVDVVFGAPRGEEDVEQPQKTGFYQRLVAGRSEERVPLAKRLAPAEGPRVEVVDTEYATGGVKSARAFTAAHIARRFRSIHDATGRPWSHMVILLGKMTNAQTYAEALDRLGVPCAITGGSVLSGRADAQVMVSLARVLANPREDDALVSVLTSDIFGLSADDLLEVRELGSSRRLGTAFMRLVDKVARGEEFAPESLPEHAATAIFHAMKRASSDSVARAMELLLAESGWLARMEAQNSVSATSRVADALKVIRMVEDIEATGQAGARKLSEALTARFEVAKESPGVLQAERGDFVRIMTIHASKGLQFPIVATAELEPGAAHGSKLTTQTSRDNTFVSLDLEHTLKGTDGRLATCATADLRKRLVDTVCDAARAERPLDDTSFRRLFKHDSAATMGARDALIRAFGSDQDDLELERKIYVALTRAEEALIVCMLTSAPTAAIDKRIKTLPGDETGVKEALRVSKSTAKGVTKEQKAEAKALADRLKSHICLPFAGEPKGMCGRIRARRATIEGCGYTYLHAPAAYVVRWEVTGELPPDWTGDTTLEGAFVDFDDVATTTQAPRIESLAALPAAREMPRPAMLRYAPQGGLGMLSASALHHAGDDDAEEPAPIRVAFDDDDDTEASATERGSAFHLMGEVAARRWKPGEDLELPTDRLEPTARLFGLSIRQAAQLKREMEVWLSSDVARDMAAHAYLEPEAPFVVELPKVEGAAQLCLTGFIDLLAYNERGSGPARVVDYKTGTYLASDETRRAAYETQARCYAFALMCQGFSEVTLDFVFVDQPDDDGMPAICAFPAPGEPVWTMDGLCDYLVREVSNTIGL